MPIAYLNGTELFYVEAGKGLPCLVMHGGLGGDHTALHPWLDPLGDVLHLVYYDHRGNGRSGRPPAETITFEQLCADADALRAHLYGLWAWNTRKSTRRKEWDESAGEFKVLYTKTTRPLEEWLFVPVAASGIPADVVARARQSLHDSARAPSKAAKRFWELSAGVLRCRECGHTLRPHTARTRAGTLLHYYSCRSRYNTGPNRGCTNTKPLRAEGIERQVWDFVRGLLKDPERIRAGLDRLIEEERVNVGRDPGRDAEFWSKRMAEAEVERRGYHRLAARGHMSDEELTAALSDLDEAREAAERELETARARGESLRCLERARDALMESYAGAVGEALKDLSPEERHRVYKLLRLDVRFRPDWPLEVSGIFAEVAEEAETGLSNRNPSLRSV